MKVRFKSSMTNAKKKNQSLNRSVRPQCCSVFLSCPTVYYRLSPEHISRASSRTYLIGWRIISSLTDILFSLLLFSSATIVPQCCLRGELLKTLRSLYHRVHECFEGLLMFMYLRISSVRGFERL